eukprot:2828032-Pyramimonas_sp.AAC.1
MVDNPVQPLYPWYNPCTRGCVTRSAPGWGRTTVGGAAERRSRAPPVSATPSSCPFTSASYLLRDPWQARPDASSAQSRIGYS